MGQHRIIRLAGLASVAVLLAAAAPAREADQGLDSARCSSLIQADVPRTRLERLARGFNLTGWLDGDDVRRPDQRALRDLRARGFTHVRLPVQAELISHAFSSPEKVSAQLKELDYALDTLLRLGYAVSIDMHPAGRFAQLWRSDQDRAARELESIWRVVARRYRDRPSDQVLFELLNEPPSGMGWAERARHLAAAIREVAPANTLVLGPDDNQRVEALEAMAPFPDSNIVYAIHYYDPMAFTHQGATWEAPDSPLRAFHDVPFPSRPDDPAVVRLAQSLRSTGRDEAAQKLEEDLRTPWTPEVIAAAIARAGAWSVRNRRAVILNEFGVLRWAAPPEDRAKWVRAVRTAADRACLGWAHWDYADAFGFMVRRSGRDSPDPVILDALIGSPASPASPVRKRP